MTVAALGLGANIGDRVGQLRAAIAKLPRPGLRVAAVSALYETPPWGKTDQPAFLNAAVRIETALSARALLDCVLGVERQLGRNRDEKWGPRTIDIDILLFGAETISEAGLQVPHPHLQARAFALTPLADVMPETRFAGRSVAEWLARAETAGIDRVAEPGWETDG